MMLVSTNDFQHSGARISFTSVCYSEAKVRLGRDDIIIERLMKIVLRQQTSVSPQKVKACFHPGCR